MKKIILLLLITLNLVGCDNKNAGGKEPIIESVGVEIGSEQNPKDQDLHFLIMINESSIPNGQRYKIRFLVQNEYISDLIGTRKIETQEEFIKRQTDDQGYQLNINLNKEILKEYKISEIKKAIETNKAVVVELYNGNETLVREVVTSFRDNKGNPIIQGNSTTNILEIKLEDALEIDTFSKAVKDSFEEAGIKSITNPNYSFELEGETYYLWMTEQRGGIANGKIMNITDPYTIYSLTDSSQIEIKKIIKNKGLL